MEGCYMIQWTICLLAVLVPLHCSAFIELKDIVPSTEKVKGQDETGVKDKSFYFVDPPQNSPSNITLDVTYPIVFGMSLTAMMSFLVFFGFTYDYMTDEKSSDKLKSKIGNVRGSVGLIDQILDEQGIPSHPSDCRSLIICTAMKSKDLERYSFGLGIKKIFRSLLNRVRASEVRLYDSKTSDYILASMIGGAQDDCRGSYDICLMDDEDIDLVLSL